MGSRRVATSHSDFLGTWPERACGLDSLPGSWGSEPSGWSVRLGDGRIGGSTSLNRERSLWTMNSIRTDALLAQDDAEDDGDTKDARSHSTEGEDNIASTGNEPGMTTPNSPQQILVQAPLVAPEPPHDTSLAVTAVPDSTSTVDSVENNDAVNTPRRLDHIRASIQSELKASSAP